MSKRQRACDACRTRKTACRIESGPPCRSCRLSDVQCTFMRAAPARRNHKSVVGNFDSSVEGLVPPAVRNVAVTTERVAEVDPNDPTNINDDYRQRPAEIQDSHLFDMQDGIDVFNMDMQDFDTELFQQEMVFESPLTDPWGSDNGISIGSLPLNTQSSSVLHDPDQRNTIQVLGETSDMSPSILRHYKFDDSGSVRFKELAVCAATESREPPYFLPVTSRPSITIFSEAMPGP